MKFHDHKFKKTMLVLALGAFASLSSPVSVAKSVYISNSGFESGLRDWTVVPSAKMSSVSRKGELSAKITGEKGMISRKVSVEKNTDYDLSAFIRDSGTIGVEVAGQTVLASSEKGSGWGKKTISFNSAEASSVKVFAVDNEGPSYFDEFSLKSTGSTQVAEVEKTKKSKKPKKSKKSKKLKKSNDVVNTVLDPTLPPSGNFELNDWNLSIPTDVDRNERSDTIRERALAKGYTNPDFFYTNANGGMVFKVPVSGFKTSENTTFTRVELREMLRRGNTKHKTQGVGKNNWVFSSAPKKDRRKAGGVDGKMTGTVSIDHVTTTGVDKEVGRVVFAQIHAGKDEPIRFYYRKLPNNSKGSIYFAHEPLEKKDIYFDMVGSRSSKAKDPEDGVALGEKFSYEIDVKGNEMKVSLFREGKADIVQIVDMSDSGYDAGGQYMYFKAGAYIQDKTGEPDDYAEVVYYSLDNSH